MGIMKKRNTVSFNSAIGSKGKRMEKELYYIKIEIRVQDLNQQCI